MEKSNGNQEKHENAAFLLIQYILSHLIPKLFETYKDFEERKVTSGFTHQAFALITTCRALLKQVSNENAQLKCAKLTRDILEKNEIGKVFMVDTQHSLYFYKSSKIRIF